MSTWIPSNSFLRRVALSLLAGILAMLGVFFTETVLNVASTALLRIPPIVPLMSLLLLYAAVGSILGLLAAPLMRRRPAGSGLTLVAAGSVGLAVAYLLFWKWNAPYFPFLLKGHLLLWDLGAVGAGFGVAFLLRRYLGERLARILVATPLVLALALLVGGWTLRTREFPLHSSETGPPPPSSPNVVLITIDTLRTRNIGAYGYPRALTPNIDRLASEGLLFENAYTPVPQTGPSHATILTGLHPLHHGVLHNGWRLAEHYLTLPEILKAHGYETFGVVSVEHITTPFGFDQGIDTFIDHNPIFNRFYALSPSLGMRFSLVEMIKTRELREFEAAWFNAGSHERRGDRSVNLILDRLEQRSNGPFFLWVHLFDPHKPYAPPAGYVEPFREAHVELPVTPFPVDQTRDVFDRYDGEVAFVDEQIGRLLRALGPDLESSLVVFVADHGESLGESGYVGHSGHVREEVVRVPLILRLPGVVPAGEVERRRAFTMDLVPTILSLVGVSVPGNLDGRDVLKEGPDRRLFLQAHSPSGFRLLGVLEGDLKIFLTWAAEKDGNNWAEAKWRAYDLGRDPEEQINLAVKPGQKKQFLIDARLLADMKRFFESEQIEPQTIDRSTLQALRALGYVQ